MANDEVGEAYRRAGVVLNDHWDDMREEGFLSNRLFDAVASGARVISDDAAGLNGLFGRSVQVVEGAQELSRLVHTPDLDTVFGDDAERRAVAASVHRDHSFDARARTLLEAAVQLGAARFDVRLAPAWTGGHSEVRPNWALASTTRGRGMPGAPTRETMRAMAARGGERAAVQRLPPPARLRVRQVKRAILGQSPLMAPRPEATKAPERSIPTAPSSGPRRADEGRSRGDIRREHIFRDRGALGQLLEIGPAHNGILRKRDGYDTRTGGATSTVRVSSTSTRPTQTIRLTTSRRWTTSWPPGRHWQTRSPMGSTSYAPPTSLNTRRHSSTCRSTSAHDC